MLKFISIGSGSSGNCYFLYTEKDGLLIDCGVGIRTLKKYFNNYGLNTADIHNILVTHDHADHVKSVGSLCKDKQIPVYTTEEVHNGIYKNWSVRKKIERELKRFLKKDETVQIGDFTITPFAVPHDSEDNVGYFIETNGVSFCIVTDCGHVTDTIKGYISKANYLVIEANYDMEMLRNGNYPAHLKRRIASGNGHLSNDECAITLVENVTPQTRQVWLCHLSEENNHPELARKTIETALGSHGIVAGKDFGLDVLKRKTPTGIYELK